MYECNDIYIWLDDNQIKKVTLEVKCEILCSLIYK